MATNSTHSKIKSTAAGGRDYSTVQAWEDDIGVGLGTSTNLVTDDYDHYGWLSAEEFDENVTIGGHTTDSTHRIYLAADSNGATVTASGHSHTKEDAALMDADRALIYSNSYASMLWNNGYTTGLTITDNHVQLSRLQFKKTTGSVKGLDSSSGTNLHINRCLIDSAERVPSAYYTTSFEATATIYASIFINSGSAGDNGALGTLTINDAIINCTFDRSSTANLSATAAQIGAGYQRPDFQNCAFFSGGAGTKFISSNGGTAWATLDYNCTDHSDLSERSGEGANNVYSKTQSDQFQAVNNTDWRIDETGTFDLDTGGTDLTGTVALDIFGNSFVAGNIGCQATAAVGGATSKLVVLNRHRGM